MLRQRIGIGGRADMQNLRPVFCKRSRAPWSRKNVREVEHLDVFQGRRCPGERYRRAIANLLDLNYWHGIKERSLLRFQPLFAFECATTWKPRDGKRVFKIFRIPFANLSRDGLLVVSTVEEIEIAVQELWIGRASLDHHMATVFALEDSVRLDELSTNIDGVTRLAYVVRWMEKVKCIDDIDLDVSTDTRLRSPDRGSRSTNEQLRSSGCFPEFVRGAYDRIVTQHNRIPLEDLR